MGIPISFYILAKFSAGRAILFCFKMGAAGMTVNKSKLKSKRGQALLLNPFMQVFREIIYFFALAGL